MKSLIYISRRTSSAAELGAEVDDIVTVARSRNKQLDVTGALIATPSHFAQVLEGTEAALQELMSSILRDKRHFITDILDLEPTPDRQFAGWWLAYHGDSSLVSAMLTEAIAVPDFELQGHVEQILALMHMFAGS
ncbi:BLUF domain-containing protein [Novosphingobium sp. G106]|uniref:BLUF domain-containing protein n=1 Tax=Novosphingobium sp. G106 TaxID=2849500 RepID=UPI001C2DA3A2|nr:BLUF domain-containing protein [Novosphingobium sp. G106]MBV1689063.1 BLUF domain-containing protein [Novosphingobium sp. G106]